MSDQTHDQPIEEEVVETYYDDEPAAGIHWKGGKGASGAACQMIHGACDEVLKAVPVDVTEHLVNSHNELMKAGVALLNSAMGKADDVRERAKAAHKPAEA
jgi:hypothetical protein